jgi:WD40 repeat protein
MTIQTSSLGLAFDPSGTRLATSNIEAGVAEIWDVASGKKLVTLAGHSGQVNDVAWDPDPDRDRIATASSDTTVRLWNATTGVPELVLHGHTNPVWHVRFSADGSRLASASLDGSVRVWALDLDDLIEIATNEVTRTLTDAECRQFLHTTRCPSEDGVESTASSIP